MAQIGVNAWVWTSPVNTAEFGRLAPMVKKMGFDLIEFGIEGTSDWIMRRPRRSPATTAWGSASARRWAPTAT